MDVWASTGSSLASLIARHPQCRLAGDAPNGELRFDRGDWPRGVRANDLSIDCRGLTELMDNNPMVCSNWVSVPGPVETLSLIALGPILKAQLLVEEPIIMSNVPVAEESLRIWLREMGWGGEVLVAIDEMELEGVAAVTVLAKIQTPENLDDIDELYEESYSRSFFVQREEEQEWDIALVSGMPQAVYRLRISEGEPHSLLRIQLLADLKGKAGDAQLIHAMNVMCGFEESLPFGENPRL